MTDFTFMESKKAKLFVNSPNALEGNEVSKCDTASAKFQSEDAGLVDFTAAKTKCLPVSVSWYPCSRQTTKMMSVDDCSDDLNRVCADLAECSRRYGNPSFQYRR